MDIVGSTLVIYISHGKVILSFDMGRRALALDMQVDTQMKKFDEKQSDIAFIGNQFK